MYHNTCYLCQLNSNNNHQSLQYCYFAPVGFLVYSIVIFHRSTFLSLQYCYFTLVDQFNHQIPQTMSRSFHMVHHNTLVHNTTVVSVVQYSPVVSVVQYAPVVSVVQYAPVVSVV